MNCKTEQAMELEALRSVFADEFIEKPPKPWKFGLSISTPGDQIPSLKAKLFISFPSKYPVSSSPDFLVSEFEGVYENKKEIIHSELKAACETNLGEQIVFLLIERLKELMTEFQIRYTSLHTSTNSKGKKKGDEEEEEEDEEALEYDEEKYEEERLRREKEEEEQAARELEEIERKRKLGTPFSVDAFAAWKAKFEAESNLLRDLATGGGGGGGGSTTSSTPSTGASSTTAVSSIRLTGKQLFESGISTALDDLPEED